MPSSFEGLRMYCFCVRVDYFEELARVSVFPEARLLVDPPLEVAARQDGLSVCVAAGPPERAVLGLLRALLREVFVGHGEGLGGELVHQVGLDGLEAGEALDLQPDVALLQEDLFEHLVDLEGVREQAFLDVRFEARVLAGELGEEAVAQDAHCERLVEVDADLQRRAEELELLDERAAGQEVVAEQGRDFREPRDELSEVAVEALDGGVAGSVEAGVVGLQEPGDVFGAVAVSEQQGEQRADEVRLGELVVGHAEAAVEEVCELAEGLDLLLRQVPGDLEQRLELLRLVRDVVADLRERLARELAQVFPGVGQGVLGLLRLEVSGRRDLRGRRGLLLEETGRHQLFEGCQPLLAGVCAGLFVHGDAGTAELRGRC